MKTILIVEDTELNIDLLVQLLEDDYTLLIAKDGNQGVVMALEHKPDLILMDISLPVMDGYHAVRQIRQTLPDIPIIGLSAHAMESQVQKAHESGCNGYLTKPLDENLLFAALKKYLAVVSPKVGVEP